MHLTPRFSRFLVVAILAVALFALGGCRRNADIYNVTREPIASVSSQQLQTNTVKNAILRAGNKLGWIMQTKMDGHLIGTLNLRSHKAVVDITYTSSTFSIVYKDSANLYYDAAKKRIHRNYNGWIKNLEHEIQVELNAPK